MESFIIMIALFAVGESIVVVALLERAFKKPPVGPATKAMNEYLRKSA